MPGSSLRLSSVCFVDSAPLGMLSRWGLDRQPHLGVGVPCGSEQHPHDVPIQVLLGGVGPEDVVAVLATGRCRPSPPSAYQIAVRISSTSAVLTSETGRLPLRGNAYRSMLQFCAGHQSRQAPCFCWITGWAAFGEDGNALDAALVGERIATRPSQHAVGEGVLAGLGERDERGGTEPEFGASSADDEPLDPASGSGRLDEQYRRCRPRAFLAARSGMPVSTCRTAPGSSRGLIQGHRVGIRGHRRVYEQPLEGVVEVPVVVQVPVVPADLAGSASRASVELWYRCVFSMPPRRNFGAGEVTDVPTKTRFRSRSTLGAVHDPT